jgi:glycosyltransferase involved in cell wall biosynthesis
MINQKLNNVDALKNGISLFFPAYNEAENVRNTIAKSVAVIEPLSCDYEIIIVDDGSRDDTSSIVKDITTKNPNVRLIRHEKNLGYGGALQTGFKSCKYGLIFFSDCDLQFDLGELKGFIEKMAQDKEIDVVIGYRIKRADPLMRKLNALGWKLWGRMLFGLQVKDVDCAFKLFKREVIQNIEIESSGALISTELLVKTNKLGYKVEQLGVHHYPRTAGRQTGAKMSVILKAFNESFKLFGKIRKYKKKHSRSL